jgi:hypothetical protein
MVKGSNERSTYIKFTDTAQLPTTPATKSLVSFSKTVELKLSTPLDQGDAAQHATHCPAAPSHAGLTNAALPAARPPADRPPHARPPTARPPLAGLTTAAHPAARPPAGRPPRAVTGLTASPSASPMKKKSRFSQAACYRLGLDESPDPSPTSDTLRFEDAL